MKNYLVSKMNQELQEVIFVPSKTTNVQSLKIQSPTSGVDEIALNQVTENKGMIFNVELSLVEPHPTALKAYRDKDLTGLSYIMKFAGQLEPIKVVYKNGIYLIFDGISRYKAALELSWKTILVQVFHLTEQEIQDQSVLRNYKTKRSLIELCTQAQLILSVLGLSQGKKRNEIELLTNDFSNIVGQDRFKIACEVVGCDIAASSLRRLLQVKEFQENGDDEVKGLGLMEKLEHGIIKINQAYNYMNSYLEEKKEQGSNALTEAMEFVKGEKYQLFNKSCENLSDLTDRSIDCIVTSPPYFQMRTYPDGVRLLGSPQHGQEHTVNEYIKKEVEIYSGVYPKLNDSGSLFIIISDSYANGANLAVIEELIINMVRSGWYLVQKIIWQKDNPKPVSNGAKRMLQNYEYVIWFVKNPQTYYYKEFKNWKEGSFKIKPCNNKEKKAPVNTKVFTISKPYDRIRSFMDEQSVLNVIKSSGFKWSELKEIDPKFRHEAPCPSVIPLLPILMTTKPNQTVLDIFNGTSTTTSLAIQLGRKAIGYDTDTKSIEFAAKRLQKAEENLLSEEEIMYLTENYFEEVA